MSSNGNLGFACDRCDGAPEFGHHRMLTHMEVVHGDDPHRAANFLSNAAYYFARDLATAITPALASSTDLATAIATALAWYANPNVYFCNHEPDCRCAPGKIVSYYDSWSGSTEYDFEADRGERARIALGLPEPNWSALEPWREEADAEDDASYLAPPHVLTPPANYPQSFVSWDGVVFAPSADVKLSIV
jgi:hypothetical protein